VDFFLIIRSSRIEAIIARTGERNTTGSKLFMTTQSPNVDILCSNYIITIYIHYINVLVIFKYGEEMSPNGRVWNRS
jgi:hypothetical protein